MSDAILISLITGGFTIAGIVLTAYVNYRLGKVKSGINGRMDELLELTRKYSKLEGREELKEELKK